MMPAREARPPAPPPLPEPADTAILAIVARRGTVSIRELCAELWPALPWLAATSETRLWAGGVIDPPAGWVRWRLQVLLKGGLVVTGPYRRGDGAFGFSYGLAHGAR